MLNPDIENLEKWLDEKLTDSFRPHFDEIPKTKSKGIYFWFMNPEGYDKLSKYVKIKPIDFKYSKEIDGVIYDLVYLGTAGVRNNSSGVNNGNLFKRLKWHINDNKSKSSLKSGTMSTFRRTIGALMENDLIENNNQDIIDQFFLDSFIVFYIQYNGEFLEVKDIISSHEEILIKNVRPIFNLDKNPNAKIENHITYSIQERRQLIEKSSIIKIINVSKTNLKKNSKNSIKIEIKPILHVNECIEFKVKKNQNIAEVANAIIDLPQGPCSIEIYSNDKTDVRNYVNGGIRHIRASNRDVVAYFNAPDTNNGNFPKSAIIEGEMNEKGSVIEEITVKVCPRNK